jgi:hypothetical protein
MPVLPEETWFSSACVAVAVEWQTNPVAQLHCPVRPFPQRCSKSEAVQNLPSSGLKAIGMTAGDRTAILLDNNSFHPSSCQPCCESQTAGVVSVSRYRQVGRQFIDITHPDGPGPNNHHVHAFGFKHHSQPVADPVLSDRAVLRRNKLPSWLFAFWWAVLMM